MANLTLFGTSTIARTLVGGETGFIGQNGSLATIADTIVASGSVDVAVLGSLFSSTQSAIDHDGTTLDLHIGSNGSAGALRADAIKSNFTFSAYVSNDGYIYSGSDALDIRESGDTGSIKIINTGTISGKSDGIVTDSGISTRIINYGEIAGGDGGIDHLQGDAFLFNRGSISGQDYGYDGAAETDIVKNSGSIDGGVKTFGGDDKVINRGTIDFVELGDGNDTYKGQRGLVEDLVKGEGGKDKLRGGADIDQFRGGGGDDDLRGRGGDDDLRGGDGKDMLRGNRGDDFLKGDKGTDTFIFAANGGFDTVADFKDGSEKLDVSALGLKNFSKDIAGNVNDAKGGSIIDLSDDFGLTIYLKGIDASDIGGSDFIF